MSQRISNPAKLSVCYSIASISELIKASRKALDKDNKSPAEETDEERLDLLSQESGRVCEFLAFTVGMTLAQALQIGEKVQAEFKLPS